jgi:predicted Zn finger-like uncharacterized protein
MLIVCPSCATSYDVEASSLEPDGRRVRCLRCRTVWRAEPNRGDKLLEAARAIAPDRSMADAMAEVGEPAVEGAIKGAIAGAMEHPLAVPAELALNDAPADAAIAGEGAWTEPAASPADGAWQEAAGAAAIDDGAYATHGDALHDNAARGDAVFGDAAEVEAPPLAPVDLDAGRPPLDFDSDHAADAAAEPNEPAEDIETYAARRQRRGGRAAWRWPLSGLQNGILALLIVDAVLIGWRDAFVRILPQTASFYATMGLPVNLRGLDFADISTATEQHDGVPILVVDGSIVNVSHRIVDVPRLKFAVRNAAGEEIYSWTAVPPRANLPPGEAVQFRSRLASPPVGGQAVLVRFMTRRDIISGGH